MAINEQVYGVKENWYVPGQHYEFGTQQYADVYYYNQIAADDKLKIKVANYNTLESPVTTVRSQIDGQYTSENYLIRNNWNPTEFTMDNSLVQFGIGPQSGLSKQEWWYVDRASGASSPDTSVPPVLKNTDTYDVTNMCLATRSNYTPFEFYSHGQGSILGGYENNYMYWQVIRGQIFGTENSFFDANYSSQWGFDTGYIYSKLVTQIPIKNLKLTPVIYAYNTALDNYKKYTSIQDYLAEKSDYPNIFCIKAKFRYRSGYNNDTDYGSNFDCYPWFFNPSSFLNGYGYNFNNQNSVYGDVYYPNRGDKETQEGITVAGRPGYGHGPNGSMLGNEIYWYGHQESSSRWSFTIGQGGRVLQTPDFNFTLGTKNLFYCDVSNISNDQITEGIRTQLASFGLFFVDGVSDLNRALDDEKTFLGILRNGVGYGDYSNGARNRDQAQWNWDTMDENEYDPSNPPLPIPDAPTQDDPYSWNSAGTNGANSFRHVYNMSFINTRNLYNYITQFMNIDSRNLAKNEEMESGSDPSLKYSAYSQATLESFMRYVDTEFTSDPLACIVDIIMYPFDIPAYLQISLGEIEPVTLGYSTVKDRAASDNFGLALSAVGGKPINGNTIAQINLGSEWIIPKFGDFRDYKPYTTIEITIPYHGTVEIDSAEFMSSQLGVIINVDVCTGLSVAYITKNGVPRISIPGNIGIHIPISGINAQSYYNQMVQRGTEIANTKVDKTKATVGMYSSVLSGAMVGAGIGAKLGTVVPGVGNAAGAILGGSLGAVSGLINGSVSYDKTSNNLKAQEYQYEHMQVSPTQVTNYSSELNIFEMPQCRITYHRCIMNSTFNPTSYGYSVGWATNKSGTVGSFPGYAKFSNAIIVGNITEEEKALILEKLQDGVIVRE